MLLLTAGLLLQYVASAQTIKGAVKDQQGKPMEKTTLSLLKASDSLVVKLSVTDKDGRYSFSADSGTYLIGATFAGYTPVMSGKVTLAGTDISVDDLVLIQSQSALQGVTVTSKRPIVEVQADKTILNVEGTINAVGNDALELLRKSPGVMVDKDDNLSLSGKNGVQVYIDGRPTPLSGADLAAYLKTLQS